MSNLQSGNGITLTVRRKAVISAVCFSLGMIIVFVGMGATATVFGTALRSWFDVLRWAAAAIIFIMGLHFVGLFKIGLLSRQFTLNLGTTNNMSFGMAFLLGLAFAFGWTPCVGPILAAILFTAAGSETLGQGVYLLIAYGVGMTMPFVVASIFIGPFLKWAEGFRRHLGRVEKATGGLLILLPATVDKSTSAAAVAPTPSLAQFSCLRPATRSHVAGRRRHEIRTAHRPPVLGRPYAFAPVI